MIDLNNYRNLFTLADNHSHRDGLKGVELIKEVSLNDTVRGFLYKVEESHVLTFTHFDYYSLCGYLCTGAGLLFKQNLTQVGEKGEAMFQFFAEKAVQFWTELESILSGLDHLFISGISMGGAMSLAFYWHLSQHIFLPVTLVTFGAPRIGNDQLREWFTDQNGLEVTSFGLVKKVDGKYRADPVCLFPPRGSDEYSFNPNLKRIRGKKVQSLERSVIGDQPDTDLSIKTVVFGSNETSRLWDEIHNLEEYSNTLEKIYG